MSGNKVTIDPEITTVGERLTEVGDSISVAFYDNGFMMEVGGVDSRITGEDKFRSVKLIGHTVDDLVALIKEATTMKRND